MSTLSMHKCSLLFAASFLFVLTINTPPAAAQECCEVNADPNTVTNPQAAEQLGTSVAVDGGTTVAGAPGFDRLIGEENFPDAGRAIVFTFNVGNQTWEVQDTLFAEFVEEQAQFGNSVAICGDVAVIGAHRADNGPFDWAGAAYIFERVGVNWIQTAKLTPSDPGHPHQFGQSVAISGDVVVIGALQAGVNNHGAAYVWVKPGGGWSDADGEDQDATLTASDGMTSDLFGRSVSIDGDVIVVGASQQPLFDGVVYVFDKPINGWADATEDAKLVALDGEAGDRFGWSVSIDGNLIIIGAPFEDADEFLNDEGAAYVFRFDGNLWIQEAKFFGCNEAPHDQFGTSVAISGNVAVIGAIQPVGPMPGNGTADAFRYLGTGWAQVGKPNASDGESNDWFGQSVSMSGDFVVIGAPLVDAENPPPIQLGAFYVFDSFDTAEACDCPWDLDGNGTVGATDLLSLLVNWGDCADCNDCPADFDGNCTVGATDLLALLVNWGPCVDEAIPLKNAQDCMDRFYPDDIAALIACIEAFGG
ncbi:MAG: FG-GAP repeat protein [Phycisphaerales bacterium]